MNGIEWEMPDPDSTRLEEAIERLFQMTPPSEKGGPPVIDVDTIQTVRSAAGEDSKTPREHMEARMTLCKDAKRRGALVLVGSEANRASYASRDPEKRTSPLAAAAESRAIEYASDLQIHMTSLDNDGTLFEAVISKNRLGGVKPRLLLRLDKATATLTEIDAASVEQQARDQKSREETEHLSKIADDVEALLKKHGPLNVREIESRLPYRSADVKVALQGLENQGAAVWSKGPRNSKVWTLTRGRS
jgi:hypothetical protein